MSTERIYNTLKGEPLQHWLTIAIIRDETGSATVETRSTIHVEKARPLTQSWGASFTDAEILNDNDLLKVVYQRFGRDVFTGMHTRNF